MRRYSPPRYEVTLTEYRLDAGHVGELTGRAAVWSRHHSPKAAGRVLGSLISGKHKRNAAPPRGMAYRYQVIDTVTGQAFCRNELR